MAHAYFDSSYAPCGFLIVRDGGDPYSETDTVLIQSDWDYPGIARSMGWDMTSLHDSQNCDHAGTDGTINCLSCGKTASAFISQAHDFIRDNEGDTFAGLDDYLAEGS